MKAVILGNTKLDYSWFVKTYRQGLKRNGVEVHQIDYKSTSLSNIKQMLLQIKSDMVFTHLTFHANINPIESVLQMYRDVHKKVGTIFAHSCNDAREVDRYMGSVDGAYQVAFVGTHALARNCHKAWNIPVYYTPYSSLCYDSMAMPVPELSFKEPVFTGSPGAHRTGWVDNRAKFIEDLQRILPLRIFQTQSSNDLRNKTPELSSSAKCIIGACVGYEIDGYADVRWVQYLGTGAFMIMRKFKGMDNLIPDNLYIPFYTYDDPYIVKQLWEEWKNKDTTEIRQRSFDFIQKYHNCKIRIKNVLNCIVEKQDTTKSLMNEFL